MAGAKIAFGSGTTELTADASGNARVTLPGSATPDQVGAVRFFSEVDDGTATGGVSLSLLSPEADLDYRLRVAPDMLLDDDTFNATAQNTGKHQYHNTTMTNAWSTSGVQTNSGSITTVSTGTSLKTYSAFPTFGTATTSGDIEVSFSAWGVANTIVDYGFGINATSAPYAPTDGVYFRANASGLFGVVNFNGTETSTSVMSFTPTLNKKYQFIVYVHHRVAEFWINDGDSTKIYGQIDTPSGYGQPHASPQLPLFIRHAIVGGAASAPLSANLSNWSVRVGGVNVAQTLSEIGNAIFGSYQGLNGGTMGSLANYANSANPTAAVPTNTTAALGTGLGGQFWETDTLAVTTDGIIMSYQLPSVGPNATGKRLKISGIRVDTYVQTALTGGGYNEQWSLAFGHTTVSLATAEAATTKAPRRIAIGSRTVAAAAAALVQLPTIDVKFTNPVYVNPGEFVALVKKKVGTAPSAGVMAHTIFLDYGWE